ncbi:hypothetical protein G6F50_013368 [Rhizopus delemar]|uniref:Uncharacterized protein n=1 Tax=Rhizopus delemar TaxID=936053 RepID=A0A9P7CEP9_9FUNG|nr:hypothetical protein G6F50_013368 [Rhizopus delemar]
MQGFQDDEPLFGRGGGGLGHLRQRLQPSAFQRLPAMEVAQHVLGDGGQVGARLLQPKLLRAGLAARLKNAGECVLRQVGGIGRIAQTPVHPGEQPVVVIAVQVLEVMGQTL